MQARRCLGWAGVPLACLQGLPEPWGWVLRLALGTGLRWGELVRATEGGRRSFTSPQVFDGLGDDASTLCDELPGAHPLLRKWMKKLAKRLS